MSSAILYTPPDQIIDNSLDARKYIERLEGRVDLDKRPYPESSEELAGPEEADSVAVLGGLSSLELSSGYMEVELDTIFEPADLLRELRDALPVEYPLFAVVDDAYSDYILKSYLRAGASAVLGTSGVLFGVVTARMGSWNDLVPYINVFRSV